MGKESNSDKVQVESDGADWSNENVEKTAKEIVEVITGASDAIEDEAQSSESGKKDDQDQRPTEEEKATKQEEHDDIVNRVVEDAMKQIERNTRQVQAVTQATDLFQDDVLNEIIFDDEDPFNGQSERDRAFGVEHTAVNTATVYAGNIRIHGSKNIAVAETDVELTGDPCWLFVKWDYGSASATIEKLNTEQESSADSMYWPLVKFEAVSAGVYTIPKAGRKWSGGDIQDLTVSRT